MPTTRLITMNASGGAFTSILATVPARRVEIREDEGTAPQGLIYQKPDDNFANNYTVGTPGSPDQPQIVLGNTVAFGSGRGPLVGLPQQGSGGAFNFRAADIYIKIQSKGAGGQKIRVIEFE